MSSSSSSFRSILAFTLLTHLLTITTARGISLLKPRLSSGGSSQPSSGGSNGSRSDGDYRPIIYVDQPAGVRQNESCKYGDCAGALPNGDIVDCQTTGTWMGFNLVDITAACLKWDYNSTAAQNWTQTMSWADGVTPLTNEQERPASIIWTAQINQMKNNSLAYCVGALQAVGNYCQGNNADTEGGVYTSSGGIASYSVDPQSEECNC